MAVIGVHTGKKGLRGQDGDDGLGISDIDNSKVSNSFYELFNKNAISKQLTWTRGSEAAFTNRYGNQTVVAAQETVQVLDYTNNFASPLWLPVNSHWTVTDTGVADPFGDTLATKITLTDPSASQDTVLSFTGGATIGKTYTASVYVQVVSGTIDSWQVAMSGTDYAGGSEFDVASLGASWVRLSKVISANSAGFFRFKIQTSGAVINVYQANVTEGIGVYDAILTEGTAPTSFATDSEIVRQNQYGFLIQPDSTNLCPFSEDLREWGVVGGSVSENLDFGTFESSSFTTITLNNASTVVSLSGLDITAGQSYSISFFAVGDSNLVASLGVSLAGSSIETGRVTEGYTRQVVKCVAVSGDTLNFSFVTTNTGTTVILAGIQVEAGEVSGYIPTAPDENSRSHDSVVGDVSLLPSLAQPFTIQLKWNFIFQTLENKYLFNIDDVFSVRLLDANVIIKVSNVDVLNIELTDIENTELFLVFDGSNMKMYENELLVGTVVYTPQSEPLTDFFIGSVDGNGTNSINGFIEKFNFWSYALTANEISYISGV